MEFGKSISDHKHLNIHMMEGVSYAQTKMFLENLGVEVRPEDHIWQYLRVASVCIPEGENEDKVIKKLLSEPAIHRVTKKNFWE